MSQTLSIAFETSRFAEIFAFAFAGFALSMALTPIYTTLAYRYKWWMKSLSGSDDMANKFLTKLHLAKQKRNIPTMAGSIFLLSVALITLTSNFSREQTWVPLAAFVAAGLVGLAEDYIGLVNSDKKAQKLSFKYKLLLIGGIALVCSWYLFAKLDISTITMPFVGDLQLGWLAVPLFMLVIMGTTNAVAVSDGLDGLAGGLAASAFGAYAMIAFIDERYGVAAFCMTMVGALLSYTWFNLYPARFFMGYVGSFSLGTSLGVIAILTDTVLLLPVIGLVFAAEAGSNLLQAVSKKLRAGRKVFRATPIHYHLELLGWEETKVTTRLWIIGQIMGFVGVLTYLLGMYGA